MLALDKTCMLALDMCYHMKVLDCRAKADPNSVWAGEMIEKRQWLLEKQGFRGLAQAFACRLNSPMLWLDQLLSLLNFHKHSMKHHDP